MLTADMDSSHINNVEIYYAISLPDDHEFKDEENPLPENLVFLSIDDASKMLKKYKGSRMKTFNNRQDALAFAISGQAHHLNKTIDDITFSPSMKQDKNYKSPSNQELSHLKRSIECGNYERVKEMIWSNPRLLITVCDTTVILMAGPRYNACHIAARADQAKIINLLLNTISSVDYLQKLYPLDPIDSLFRERINLLVDSYLNTPDKVMGNTPLHFACKQGHEEVVKVLLSFKDCDLAREDRDKKTPEEVICDRKGDSALKTRIKELFKARLFLPIFRDGASAKVGKPVPFITEDFVPESLIGNLSVNNDLDCSINSTTSSVNDQPRLVALAGPMLPEQADELYNILKVPRKAGKTPSSPMTNGQNSSPKQVLDEHKRIRCSDDQKGVERIARDMCRRMDIKWIEYWPFLEDSVDLSSELGLDMLERHLRSIHDRLCDNDLADLLSVLNIDDKSNLFNNNAIVDGSFSADLNGSYSEQKQQDMTNSQEKCDETDNDNLDDEDEKFYTPPPSPVMFKEYYVNGTTKPSKWDFSASIAINDTINLDKKAYIYIKDWLRRVKNLPDQRLRL